MWTMITSCRAMVLAIVLQGISANQVGFGQASGEAPLPQACAKEVTPATGEPYMFPPKGSLQFGLSSRPGPLHDNVPLAIWVSNSTDNELAIGTCEDPEDFFPRDFDVFDQEGIRVLSKLEVKIQAGGKYMWQCLRNITVWIPPHSCVHVRGGVLGATAVGVAFVAPSFLMVVAISALYVRYDGLKWMQALFYGIGAAVIGIILRSTIKLGRATLKKDPFLWAIFFVLAISTAYTGREIIWLFLLAGLVSLGIKTWSSRTRSVVFSVSPATFLFAVPTGKHWALFLFFVKSSLFVFGSGLAIIPFLHGGVVESHQWLNEHQFLDAICGCDDHSGASGHYSRVYWLSG